MHLPGICDDAQRGPLFTGGGNGVDSLQQQAAARLRQVANCVS